jgi:hypothetical protein
MEIRQGGCNPLLSSVCVSEIYIYMCVCVCLSKHEFSTVTKLSTRDLHFGVRSRFSHSDLLEYISCNFSFLEGHFKNVLNLIELTFKIRTMYHLI